MSHDKWFALVAGQIKGPYRKIELETLATGWESALIWGKGQHDWLSVEKWKLSLLESMQKQQADHERADRAWRVLVNEDQVGPMNYESMIKYLQSKSDLSQVKIWTEGYSEWKEVYQIHKLMDDLGVSRRAHPRVPILGTMQCDSGPSTFTARLLSISQGGLGATDAKSVKIGDRLRVVVKSQALSQLIAATVEVVFIGRDGYFGMKFLGLQTESRNLIEEFVNRYSGSITHSEG